MGQVIHEMNLLTGGAPHSVMELYMEILYVVQHQMINILWMGKDLIQKLVLDAIAGVVLLNLHRRAAVFYMNPWLRVGCSTSTTGPRPLALLIARTTVATPSSSTKRCAWGCLARFRNDVPAKCRGAERRGTKVA